VNASGQSASFVPWIIFLAVVGWVVYSRSRPQRVRLTRTIIYTVMVVLASVAGLAANGVALRSPLFLGIAPVALLVGMALGWLMMRTIRFWRDHQTGDVWMSGGVAYVAIWLATLIVRFGVDYAATGTLGTVQPSSGTRATTPLSVIASDLLLLSVGLWLVRGYALVRRYRELAAPESVPPRIVPPS
jgi:hypothetical protein